MRRPAAPLATVVATLALAAGCGGPELQVKPLNGEDEGKVYFRALQDRDGGDRSQSGEVAIGDMPTDWEIPEDLRGGKGQVRVVYADGTVRTVEYFAILKDDRDTVIRVTKPAPKPKPTQVK
jgi:hypothetical protein